MTTIAYRQGFLAADSQYTHSSPEDKSGGSDRKQVTQKLFRKKVRGRYVILATAGDGAPGMVFVDWYGKKGKPPAELREADISILVWDGATLTEFDGWCRGEVIIEPFYAIGSGAKAALGAMHMGATAYQAVCIAAKIDPYTGGAVTTMGITQSAAQLGRTPG